MQKYSLAIVVIVIGVVLIVGQAIKKGQTQSQNEVVIGASLPLTGDVSQYGIWSQRASDMAIEELNSSRKGDQPKLRIQYEDNKGDTATAVSSYNKLKTVDGVHYVTTITSGVSLALAKLANPDKIILFSLGATTPAYSSLDDYTFRTSPNANQLAEQSARVLTDTFHKPKVAILYINNDFGKGMINSFKQKYNGPIVAEEGFPAGGTDFKTQLTKVKDAQPDYIFLSGQLKEDGVLFKQSKELGITTPYFSDVYAVEGSDMLNTAKDAANGVIYVSPKFDLTSSSSPAGSFAAKYKAKYHDDPSEFAAQGYDGILALGHAIQSCASTPTDTDCVKKALEQTNFNGASGLIKFDAYGDVQKDVELKTIKNQQYVPYQAS